ncbi:hypothetical protein N7474_003901 [Penicillium riverlandense]|uniref:uncharacterized protein n=1 Tax=Penicillium riverlandense TaxID=1903569 RepID=UPI0025489DBA|nr:uncharacterized protein N7474_003901 [Penicillium riverlandense]KAJ5818310.1 hypothetical protein N7474_003901 [Penicillium riverlandense]
MSDLSLSAFPYLTPAEFSRACQAVAQAAWDRPDGGWETIRLVTQSTGSMLRITQHITDIPHKTVHSAESEAIDDEEEEEQDPVCTSQPPRVMLHRPDQASQEALVRAAPNPSLQVDYDILLSSTYRVPVLFFRLKWNHHHHGPVGLDAVYQYVVPEQYRQGLQSVGVMGGISLGYHPESGAPAFFVHPCNTADAMAHLADARNVTPGAYLFIWLGLVGHCVNLHVPRELVAPDGTSPLRGHA